MNPRTQSTGLAWCCLALALLTILIGEYAFGVLFAFAGVTWLALLFWQDEKERRARRRQRDERLRVAAESARDERTAIESEGQQKRAGTA